MNTEKRNQLQYVIKGLLIQEWKKPGNMNTAMLCQLMQRHHFPSNKICTNQILTSYQLTKTIFNNHIEFQILAAIRKSLWQIRFIKYNFLGHNAR